MSVLASTVNPNSAILSPILEEQRLILAKWDISREDLEFPIHGTMRRIQVVVIKRGPKKSCTYFFYSRSDRLRWDPERYEWDVFTSIMNYTTELGRNIFKQRHVVPEVILKKWQGILSLDYKLRWNNIWDQEKVCKEASLIWLTWHMAMAVNKWRGQVNIALPQACRVCNEGLTESILHKFWECTSAKKAWA